MPLQPSTRRHGPGRLRLPLRPHRGKRSGRAVLPTTKASRCLGGPRESNPERRRGLTTAGQDPHPRWRPSLSSTSGQDSTPPKCYISRQSFSSETFKRPGGSHHRRQPSTGDYSGALFLSDLTGFSGISLMNKCHAGLSRRAPRTQGWSRETTSAGNYPYGQPGSVTGCGPATRCGWGELAIECVMPCQRARRVGYHSERIMPVRRPSSWASAAR